jgi:hypothetical protein
MIRQKLKEQLNYCYYYPAVSDMQLMKFQKSLIFRSETKNHKYIFDSFVCNYLGIGRFVLGLMDEISIISPADFKEYLNKRIKNKVF